MTGKITSLDVAARAGVSQSAVSRVFSGASASRSTVDKVRRAAQELGYTPNVVARSLITGRSRIVGLVMSYMDNQFYPDALQRLSHSLKERGYHILMFVAPRDGEDIDPVVNRMLDYQVDGIVAASVGLTDALTDRCAAHGIPVVLFNRGQETREGGVHWSQVTSDNISGGYKVAKHLAGLGRQRIGHISGWQGSSTGRDRANGFVAGLQDHGLTVTAQIDGHYQRDVAGVAAAQMVREHNVDALFVGNDHMAFAVMDVLRSDLGVMVPDDVAVVGYDDVPMAAWAGYDLSTVRQPVGRMVDAVVDALMAVLNGKTPLASREIDGALIIRSSSHKME